MCGAAARRQAPLKLCTSKRGCTAAALCSMSRQESLPPPRCRRRQGARTEQALAEACRPPVAQQRCGTGGGRRAPASPHLLPAHVGGRHVHQAHQHVGQPLHQEGARRGAEDRLGRRQLLLAGRGRQAGGQHAVRLHRVRQPANNGTPCTSFYAYINKLFPKLSFGKNKLCIQLLHTYLHAPLRFERPACPRERACKSGSTQWRPPAALPPDCQATIGRAIRQRYRRTCSRCPG
jgi:hypothetical protein